jgi:hypothetical protein
MFFVQLRIAVGETFQAKGASNFGSRRRRQIRPAGLRRRPDLLQQRHRGPHSPRPPPRPSGGGVQAVGLRGADAPAGGALAGGEAMSLPASNTLMFQLRIALQSPAALLTDWTPVLQGLQ